MKKQVYQTHHITYEPEVTVRVTRGEHYVISQLQRFKALTRGAKRAIRYILKVAPIRKEGE